MFHGKASVFDVFVSHEDEGVRLPIINQDSVWCGVLRNFDLPTSALG
tara:strand:- start:951 stop:1091 length:141 start_codon:yes stop_codon:yes gene_type:complete